MADSDWCKAHRISGADVPLDERKLAHKVKADLTSASLEMMARAAGALEWLTDSSQNAPGSTTEEALAVQARHVVYRISFHFGWNLDQGGTKTDMGAKR